MCQERLGGNLSLPPWIPQPAPLPEMFLDAFLPCGNSLGFSWAGEVSQDSLRSSFQTLSWDVLEISPKTSKVQLALTWNSLP